MPKIRLSKKEIQLFNDFGTTIITREGDTYRYLPFWFKQTKQKSVFELITFAQLPDDVLDDTKTMREIKK